MIEKNINKKVNLLLVIVFLLIIFSNLVLAGNQAKLNRFKDSETKLILTNVNRYTPLIEKYADEFEVPKSLLQAVMGATKTAGILDPTDVYDENGAIGLMQLVPFDNEGKSLHHYVCLESGCMNDEVENLDKLHLDENREKVKYEYSNPHSSICCAAYILKKGSSAEAITYPEAGSDCENSRSKVTYTDWGAAVRKLNPFYCGDDNNIYFVERVMQLNSSFTKFNREDIINYGLLKFVPSFKIKAPKFPSIYSNLTKIISDLQTLKSQAGVNSKLASLASEYNITFTQFCEEEDVNLFNYIYDNLVNAIELGHPACKYVVADQFPFPGHINDQTLSFDHNNDINKLNIKNNLSIGLFREYDLDVPENFFLGFDNLTITQENTTYSMSYNINKFNRPDSTALMNIEKVYFVSDYASDVSELVFYKNVSGFGGYYNSSGDKINMTLNPLPDCNSSLDNYRLKYFTCLDTGEKEEVYDWMSAKWVESDENIVIKLAFALSRI